MTTPIMLPWPLQSGFEAATRALVGLGDQSSADYHDLSAQRYAIAAVDVEQVVDGLDDPFCLGVFDGHAAAARWR